MKLSPHHIHHYHRHMSYSYAVSLRQRLYSLLLVPLALLLVGFLLVKSFGFRSGEIEQLDWVIVGSAAVITLSRLLIAYLLALFIAIPLALLINFNSKAEKILLPLFDILQSVPVLAFFPIIILFFVHYNFLNGAAIFILLITMMWSLVFSMVGGLRVIPSDIKAAAQVFGITGFSYIRKILLPAIFPYLVTGSLLAWAGGWNIVIVAEVLHTYIPGSNSASDLFGIGSVMVQAAAAGRQHDFFMAILAMIIVVALLNFFLWQKLLRHAEKYKFE